MKKILLKRGFTLVELLIVIAILSILAAILFPVFGRAREQARRSSCLSNIRQLGMAFVQYVQDNDEQFPFNKTNALTGQQSWVVAAQPYLKNQNVLRCPSDTSQNWDAPLSATGDFGGLRTTSYTMNLYLVPATNPASPKPYSYLAASPSPSKVVFLGEAAKNFTAAYFHASVWPTAHWITTSNLPDDLDTNRHHGGSNFCYLDGHAKWSRWEQLWPYSGTQSNAATVPVSNAERGAFFPGQE